MHIYTHQIQENEPQETKYGAINICFFPLKIIICKKDVESVATGYIHIYINLSLDTHIGVVLVKLKVQKGKEKYERINSQKNWAKVRCYHMGAELVVSTTEGNQSSVPKIEFFPLQTRNQELLSHDYLRLQNAGFYLLMWQDNTTIAIKFITNMNIFS